LAPLEKAALLSGKNVWETRAAPRIGLRSLWFSDGPHGVRRQAGSADHLGLGPAVPATCFPTAVTLANTWDPALVEDVGRAIGREARERGVDVLLGPGLNIKRSPLGGRNFEYFSEDPYLAGVLAAGFIRGVQSTGVAACPKHFAAGSQESRRMASDSVVDQATLREIYLTGFEIAVRQGRPWAIMTSYNKVNGVYAHENPFLLRRVLRDEWGFDGLVVSDWGAAGDPVAEIRAGGTLEMPSPGLDSVDRIMCALAAGDLAESELDPRVAEVITLARRIDAARGPAAAPGEAVPAAQGGLDDVHHALARRAAARGTVLLKNEGGLLPLAAGTRVALLGDLARAPRYQGAGSSQVNPIRLRSALDAVGATRLELVAFAPGYRRGAPPDAALIAEAVAAADGADVVLLYLGLEETAESEGLDRSHLSLPAAQLALIDALAGRGEGVVAVLAAGGVVETPWLDACDALCYAGLGGGAGAEAVLDLITGAELPSGRLAETHPLELAHAPNSDCFPATARHAEYRERHQVGYRHYTTAAQPVRFPFGFGLTYTTFAYSDLVVAPRGASFVVANTGARPGRAVAQLYIGHPAAPEAPRPSRELKGFVGVELAPGEHARVEIPFDRYTFRHFDARADAWSPVPVGPVTVMIGADAQDIKLQAMYDAVPSAGGTAPVAAQAPIGDDSEQRRRDLGAASPRRRALRLDDPLGDLPLARSWLARLVGRVLRRRLRRAEARGQVDIVLLFALAMPFRALPKVTGGMVSSGMAEAILTQVNGRFWRGTAALVKQFWVSRRASKRLGRELAALAGGPDPGRSGDR
jgi:beta-glucosidase